MHICAYICISSWQNSTLQSMGELSTSVKILKLNMWVCTSRRIQWLKSLPMLQSEINYDIMIGTWITLFNTTINSPYLQLLSVKFSWQTPQSPPWGPEIGVAFFIVCLGLVVVKIFAISCYIAPSIVSWRYTELFGDIYYTIEWCRSCVVMATIDPVLVTAYGILYW